MKHPLPAVLFAVVILSSTPLAQSKPDFSGTWSMDASRSQSAVQNEPVRAMTMVIKQTATELNIETKRDDRLMTVTYKPGSPDSMSTNTGRPALLASTWYWDGPRLVTETVRDVSGATVRTKEVHSLEAGGSEMTVETLVIVEHGYTLRGAQNYGSGKDVFKKVAP
jgi:hypothetical protein